MGEKRLIKGNEAFAMSAIRNGCRFYFGYPITPQNEIPEYMSRELEKAGGKFLQAESELAAVNMAFGAACAGGRVLLSSSSPGIALMQEGLSYMASVQVPVVVLNVMRGGPGVGTIQPAQQDYFQVTRGGGNGDYNIIVYAPSSIQEAVDMIGKAYEVADEYRNPVIIAVDGMIGQMMEPVILPDPKPAMTEEEIDKAKPWALTGHKDKRDRNVIKSLHLKQDELENLIHEYWPKYERAERELPEYEAISVEGAEVVFVAYGSTARITVEAMTILAEKGVKTGLIRPKTLWPFPYHAFDKVGDDVKRLISVELSMGQMIQDVRLAIKGRHEVDIINRVGGMLLSPIEIAERTLKLLGGEK